LVLAGLYTLSASIIWGVNTLFLLNAGLEILEVFIANAIFTGSMALFEIPTGVLADTRGRRASFLLSIFILMIGTLGYVGVAEFGGGLLWFGLMSVVLGLGFTFYSGAMEAWLVDALNASGFTGQLDRVFSRASIVSGIAMIVGTTGGGLLGTLDLSIPFLVRSALLAIVFVIAYVGMHDVGFVKHSVGIRDLPHEMRKVAQSSIMYGWKEKQVRLLILAGAVQSMYMAWGFFAWQPYFLELLGQNLVWISGLIAALVAVAMIVGNSLVEVFTRFCGRRTTLILWAVVVAGIATIGVGLASNFYVAVGLYLVTMVSFGVISPVKQAYMHQVIPSEQRATVISFDALVASGGSMVGQTSLGYLSQNFTLGGGYVVGGIVTLFSLPATWLLRGRDEPADFFEGSAGQTGACAAQGMPNAMGVEAHHSAAHGAAGD
jgi:MFS family permease